MTTMTQRAVKRGMTLFALRLRLPATNVGPRNSGNARTHIDLKWAKPGVEFSQNVGDAKQIWSKSPYIRPTLDGCRPSAKEAIRSPMFSRGVVNMSRRFKFIAERPSSSGPGP